MVHVVSVRIWYVYSKRILCRIDTVDLYYTHLPAVSDGKDFPCDRKLVAGVKVIVPDILRNYLTLTDILKANQRRRNRASAHKEYGMGYCRNLYYTRRLERDLNRAEYVHYTRATSAGSRLCWKILELYSVKTTQIRTACWIRATCY